MDRDDEVEPGKDGTEAGDEDAGGGGYDMGVEIVGAQRRSKIQPVSTPPSTIEVRVNSPPMTNRYQLRRFNRGKARSSRRS